LRRFEAVALLDPDLAVKAAVNYRFLRRRGIPIRKTIDLVIGTFCTTDSTNATQVITALRDLQSEKTLHRLRNPGRCAARRGTGNRDRRLRTAVALNFPSIKKTRYRLDPGLYFGNHVYILP